MPAFDGNLANLVWGGRLESITGEKKLASANVILFDPFGGSGDYGTPSSTGPVEIVISFFKRDTARIGSVTITTLSRMYGMRDVEAWASPTSATEGFTKPAEAAGAGYVPLLRRHPEILEPAFVAEGTAAAAAQASSMPPPGWPRRRPPTSWATRTP